MTSSVNTFSIALFNDIAFGSEHPKGTNFCLADASVRYVGDSISLGVYRALASRDGNESVALP